MTNPDERAVELLAAAEIDDIDVHNLDRVAAVFDLLDPVPTGLVERIQFGITLDALHAEIAELQRTSELAGVRSGDAAQAETITFTSASLTTMVTISPSSADHVRIDGWIAPASVLSVELRVVGAVLSTSTDEDGRFVFEDVPRGLAQFVIRPAAGDQAPPVITPSIDL
jgi:hypothetical protein